MEITSCNKVVEWTDADGNRTFFQCNEDNLCPICRKKAIEAYRLEEAEMGLD